MRSWTWLMAVGAVGALIPMANACGGPSTLSDFGSGGDGNGNGKGGDDASGNGGDDGGIGNLGDDGGGGGGGDGGGGGAKCLPGAMCNVKCPGNGTTSITGTVMDPAGKNP